MKNSHEDFLSFFRPPAHDAPVKNARRVRAGARLSLKQIGLSAAMSVCMLVSIPAIAGVDFAPIKFRQTSGTRPFVDVQLNGQTFAFMVHSNAGFYAMTNHANAAKAEIINLEKKDAYGINKPGVVSSLGRDKAKVKTLQVGKCVTADASVLIFETPDENMDGMLGIRWLRDKRVIVDYDKYRIGLPAENGDSEKFDADLIQQGYVAHDLEWDPKASQYFVNAIINGNAARLSVNTVSWDALDIHFAAAAKIELGPVVDEYSGPAGATGQAYLSKKVLKISLDGQAMQDFQPRIFDKSDYSSGAYSPEKTAAGDIGADFMLANQAVIDFGTGRIFIKSP